MIKFEMNVSPVIFDLELNDLELNKQFSKELESISLEAQNLLNGLFAKEVNKISKDLLLITSGEVISKELMTKIKGYFSLQKTLRKKDME